jgi:hypothetical protein
MATRHGIFAFLLSFFIFLTPLSISAQAYGTAVGVRFYDDVGLTLQQQIAQQYTIEGILQSRFFSEYRDVTLSVLGERHQALLTRGLSFYWGAGLYTTWLDDRPNLIQQPKNPVGITPIAGLELTIAKFNISADFKPLLKLSGGAEDTKFFQWQIGISVRRVIAGRYFKNEDWKFWKKKRR